MTNCDFLPLFTDRSCFLLSIVFVCVSVLFPSCCLCLCRIVLYAEDISVFRMLSTMCDTRPVKNAPFKLQTNATRVHRLDYAR